MHLIHLLKYKTILEPVSVYNTNLAETITWNWQLYP